MSDTLREAVRKPGCWSAGLFVLAAVAAALLAWRGSPAATVDAVVIEGTAVPPLPTLDKARVAQGQALYAAHCAACHGANLEGAPNWKTPGPDGAFPPPPHDDSGHTWHHPDALLLEIISAGGDLAQNSRMPAFENTLTVDERQAVLDFIKSRWGREAREFQWWITVK